MFILFTNLFLTRPFRLENTLECYNLRGGQRGSTEVSPLPILHKRVFLNQANFCVRRFASLRQLTNGFNIQMNQKHYVDSLCLQTLVTLSIVLLSDAFRVRAVPSGVLIMAFFQRCTVQDIMIIIYQCSDERTQITSIHSLPNPPCRRYLPFFYNIPLIIFLSIHTPAHTVNVIKGHIAFTRNFRMKSILIHSEHSTRFLIAIDGWTQGDQEPEKIYI